MKNPKILLYRYKVIFQIVCFLFAVYFTARFSSQYSENSDVQLITMKKFNEKTDSSYPTYSFCFKGARFHWFHDLEIFNSFSLNATQYERMMMGETSERYDRNDFNRSYIKTPVFLNSGNKIDFDSYYVQISDFLSSLHFAAEPASADTLMSSPKEMNLRKDPALYLSYHTADKVCYSRKVTDHPDSIRLNDLITFNSSILLLYPETKMEVFVHYPNQLMRVLEKPKYSASFVHLQSILSPRPSIVSFIASQMKILEFKLTESKRIKKRHDSNEKCNQNIENYDRYLYKTLAEKLNEEIGCVPIYLMTFLSSESKFDVCYSQLELQQAHKIVDEKTKIPDYLDLPCDDLLLLSIDSINNNPNPIPKDIAIQFFYTEKTYEEIHYIRAIGFENWLSNVGGFVGIFLGYSMMQFPELFLFLVNGINRKRRILFAGIIHYVILSFILFM